jgi:hypothetical protein
MAGSRVPTLPLLSICLLATITTRLIAAETAYKPAGPITVRVWTNSSSSPPFVYPELSDGEFGMPQLQKKLNFGICVSGGALTAELGYNSMKTTRVTVYLGKFAFTGTGDLYIVHQHTLLHDKQW